MADVFHTCPEDARNLAGWYALPSGIEVMREPMTDEPSGLYSRLDYDEAEALAHSMGARLISMATLAEIWRHGCRIQPVQLITGRTESEILAKTRKMRGREFCETHDSLSRTYLKAAGWDRDDPASKPVSGLGKHWIRGASKSKARNGGWPNAAGVFVQPGGPGSEHHDRHYTDYSQLAQFERVAGISMPPPIHTSPDGSTQPPGDPRMRSTIRQGSTGADVGVWQRTIGVTADEQFGPATAAKTRTWQAAHGLFADGVVGPQSWRAAGEEPAIQTPHGPAPACVQALRDASRAWPERRRASDGIMGDASHQARPSDHNLGLAVDITHDPASGCDGELVSMMARRDPRVTYIIWRARIWNRGRDEPAGPGRPYTGSNPHHHHVHISIRPEARDDVSPWPWAAV